MSNTRSPRFMHWLAFLVFSTITLGSVVEVVKAQRDDQNEDGGKSAGNWTIACSAITFSVTLIVVLMHLNSVTSIIFVGTKIEGVICFILAIFWIATVAVVTDSRHGLAVDDNGAVDNGNLYYFSWGGFVCSVLLCVSYLNHAFSVDIAGELKTRSARLTLWAATLATSLVVMGSSANFFDNTCGDDNEPDKCSRAVFGIVLGALATLAAVCIVGMKVATARAPFLVETLISFLLVILYGLGVAFITSQKGPGAELGNLYYFTWASFLISFALLASCFEDYNAASDMQTGGGQSHVAMDSPPVSPTGMEMNHVIHDDLEDQI